MARTGGLLELDNYWPALHQTFWECHTLLLNMMSLGKTDKSQLRAGGFRITEQHQKSQSGLTKPGCEHQKVDAFAEEVTKVTKDW